MAKMKYVRLGKSGLKVSRLILGTLQYGSKQDWMISNHQEALEQLKHAYDVGINAFDTSNSYSGGESEVILGKFLKHYDIPRESVVILTKTFYPAGTEEEKGPAGFVNHQGLSRKRIFASVEESLSRLQLDYIDVLQCHRFDVETPIEETMRALHDVVLSGKVRYIGMSSCLAWQFQVMQQYALQHNLTPFISMQDEYNAISREQEREMILTLDWFGVGSIPYGSLAHGLLCRPSEASTDGVRGQQLIKMGKTPVDNDQPIIAAVEQIAKDKNITMAQVALLWCLHKSSITAPIIGTTSSKRLDELVNALDMELMPEEIAAINHLYKPKELNIHI